MLKGLSTEKTVSFLRNCFLLETKMTETLDMWKSKMDVTTVLEESPWLDETTAALTLLEPGLREVFALAEEFIQVTRDFTDNTSGVTPKVQFVLYFESPITEYMRKILDTGAQIAENDFMSWRGRFEKAHLTLRNFIKEAFGIEDYLSGSKERVYEAYEVQYGSLKEFFEKIAEYCATHPLFYSEVVEKNSELFQRLLAGNTEVSKEQFDTVCEAVMPWDVVMFKRNELAFDNLYIARLEKRIEDPSSIYNDIPIIWDTMDKLPDERCKDLYTYEFLIGTSSVAYIKEGTATWDEVLDDLTKLGETSYF